MIMETVIWLLNSTHMHSFQFLTFIQVIIVEGFHTE